MNQIKDHGAAEMGSIQPTSHHQAKRGRILVFLIFLLFLSAIFAALIWWLFYKNHQTTDDAYVSGQIIFLSSRQDGAVKSCTVEETDYVNEGEILIVLDPTDYLGNVEQKKASLAKAAMHVRSLFEDVNQKKANVRVEEAKYARASLNYKNRQPLLHTEAIPQEDIEHAEADFKVQEASLDLARYQLAAAEAAVGRRALKNHPDIEKARVELLDALIALSRCQIRAPISGYIANKNVQVGQSIKAGTSLMNIVPLKGLWVDANFKETQLENIRMGQPVTLISDIYGRKVPFHGKVEGLVPGSGSTFSLLPTQNATGNWIKIVQRVAVRLSLDEEALKNYPLVLGLTMTVTVDVSDVSGSQLSEKPVQQISKTHIFDVDPAAFDEIIDQIIVENLQGEKSHVE